uniref:F-box domain-containing protein n=1 Tax=Leersia perrieri TaxID=77586 RepID=A0A0D9W4R2_9ORYZ
MVATTIEDLHGDVLARALRRLDGRSLAAASCATASLRALAADPDTWRALCLAEWPSLASHPRLLSAVSPRRLFAEAFAVVLGGCKFEATVTCSSSSEGAAGHVTEVSLAVQDADGAAASGERSLRLLVAAMEEQRIGGSGERQREEAKRRYDEFLRRKKGRKESKVRREALIDLCCSAASAMAVLCFLAAVVLR